MNRISDNPQNLIRIGIVILLIVLWASQGHTQEPNSLILFSPEKADANAYSSCISKSLWPRIAEALTSEDSDSKLRRLLKGQCNGKYFIKVDPSDNDIRYDLRGITIRKSDITGKILNLSRVVLDYSHIEGINLDRIKCTDCYLRGVVFQGGSAKGADFQEARLDSAKFFNVDLSQAQFQGASFGEYVQFINCNLDQARFAPSLEGDMPGGTRFDFRFGSMHDTFLEQMNLNKATFAYMDMRGSHLARADLSESKLSEVVFDQLTDFQDASLEKAVFNKVQITSPIRFVGTNINNASLHELDVSKIDFTTIDFREDKFYVGEELEADQDQREVKIDPNARNEKHRLYAEAASVYRALAIKFQQSSALHEFRWCRYRAMDCRRKFLQTGGMGGFFELSYLFLIWLIDGYGTSPMHLFVTILASIVLFSPAYLPVSKLLHKAKSETAASSSTKKHWMDYGRVYITAIAISLEATFAVIERIPGLPDVVKIIKGQTNSLFLSQYLRIVYCAQALFGAFMMARGIRIWLLFFS